MLITTSESKIAQHPHTHTRPRIQTDRTKDEPRGSAGNSPATPLSQDPPAPFWIGRAGVRSTLVTVHIARQTGTVSWSHPRDQHDLMVSRENVYQDTIPSWLRLCRRTQDASAPEPPRHRPVHWNSVPTKARAVETHRCLLRQLSFAQRTPIVLN